MIEKNLRRVTNTGVVAVMKIRLACCTRCGKGWSTAMYGATCPACGKADAVRVRDAQIPEEKS